MSEDHLAVERMKKIDELLDSYEENLGLTAQSEKDYEDIGQYLNMSRDQLEKFDPQDCSQIVYRLSSFALFLNRSYNREMARYNWSESLMKELTAPRLDQQSGYGFIEKYNKAVVDDEYTRKLNEINRYAKQRSDRLSFLSNSVKNLADSLKNIQ